jgi:hypothetical protein
MGDAAPSTDGESGGKRKAPSLRLPGEELPGTMQRVNMPGQPDTKPQPIPPPPGSSPSPDPGSHWSAAELAQLNH